MKERWRNGREPFHKRMAIYSVPLLFLSFFCLYPLGLMMSYGLKTSQGDYTFENLKVVLTDAIYLKVIWFTFWQSGLSAILTLILALPGAYLLSAYDFPGKRAVMAATTVPFVVPSLVLAVGMIAIFGSGGNLNSLIDRYNSLPLADLDHLDLIGSRTLIVIAHIFFNFPIAIRILHARFVNMDPDLVRAARSFGAGKIRILFQVIIPQLRYSILSSLSLIFTFCFLSFGIVLLIGGLNHTIEVEIRSLFIALTGERFHHAGALVIIESLIVIATTLIYIWSSSKDRSREEVAFFSGPILKRKISPLAGVSISAYVLMVILVVFSPIIVVIIGSLFSGNDISSEFTFIWYERILTMESSAGMSITPLDAIRNSILFGFLAMVLSVPLSYLTAWAMVLRGGVSKRFLDMMLLFPLGASSVALGYGLVKAYSTGPIHLSGTWYIIVLVHAVIAYPIGARAIYSSMMSIPKDLARAARSLGASRFEAFFNIELPLLMPGILVAAVFAFAVSIGELGATMMVSSEEFITMPVFLYRTIEGAGRQLGPMYAYSVILIAITFLSFLSIEIIQKMFVKWGIRE